MPRNPTGWFDDKAGRYFARLGPPSPKTGKPTAVMLRHEDGRPIAKGDKGAVAAAVQRLLAERERADEAAKGPSVADLFRGYLAWHRARGSKPTTIETHVYNLTLFGGHEWGGVPYRLRAAESIGLADLTRVRKAMESRGCGAATVRLLYSSVLACWAWAARPVEDRVPERLLKANPFEGVARPTPTKSRRAVLPWPTIAALLAFADRRNESVWPPLRDLDRRKALALRVVAESGARPREAYTLRWDWFSADDELFAIPPEHHKTGWKTRKERVIVVRPETASRLAELRAARRSHPDYAFAAQATHRDVAPRIAQFQKWFRALRDDAIGAGIPLPPDLTLYALRHSWVTNSRQGGVDLRDSAAAAGHGEQVAENTYLHHDHEHIAGVFRRVWATQDAAAASPPPASRSRPKPGGGPP